MVVEEGRVEGLCGMILGISFGSDLYRFYLYFIGLNLVIWFCLVSREFENVEENRDVYERLWFLFVLRVSFCVCLREGYRGD